MKRGPKNIHVDSEKLFGNTLPRFTGKRGRRPEGEKQGFTKRKSKWKHKMFRK